MANGHYRTKAKRRPRNSNRRDWTKETMLKLRTPEQTALEELRASQNKINSELCDCEECIGLPIKFRIALAAEEATVIKPNVK